MLKITHLGDQIGTELGRQRSHLPEPARVKVPYYRSIEQPAPYSYADWCTPIAFINTENWEKVLIHEPGVEYYAWKNTRTGEIFT